MAHDRDDPCVNQSEIPVPPNGRPIVWTSPLLSPGLLLPRGAGSSCQVDETEGGMTGVLDIAKGTFHFLLPFPVSRPYHISSPGRARPFVVL
jgi:hypothetical protein